MINQKWVTDVSEFKYGVGEDDKKGKLYLSARKVKSKFGDCDKKSVNVDLL